MCKPFLLTTDYFAYTDFRTFGLATYHCNLGYLLPIPPPLGSNKQVSSRSERARGTARPRTFAWRQFLPASQLSKIKRARETPKDGSDAASLLFRPRTEETTLKKRMIHPRIYVSKLVDVDVNKSASPTNLNACISVHIQIVVNTSTNHIKLANKCYFIGLLR